MILEKMGKNIRKPFKRAISNYRIQNKLFLASIFLLLVILLTIYFLSQIIISNLIIQKQVESEYGAFSQVNKYLKTLFSASEAYIDTIYKNPSFRELLSEQLDQKDSEATYKYLNKMENIINTFLVNKEMTENIIILGRNNVSSRYSQTDARLSTSVLDKDFDWTEFLKKSELLPFINTSTYPFYFEEKRDTDCNDSTNKKIHNLIENRIIFIRTIRNEENQIEGVIIIVFNDNLISDILNIRDNKYEFFLISGNGHIVSTNEIINKNKSFDYFPMLSDVKGFFKGVRHQEEYLFIYDTLSPFDFKIVSSIALKIVLNKKEAIRTYALLFCGACYIFALIASFLFSKSTCYKLNLLAAKLKSEELLLPQRIDMGGTAFSKRINLRKGIFGYFLVTVILPTVVFITVITIFNYNIYREKLIQSASFNVKQLKENVDYKIKNYHQISKQIIFDESVQNFLDISSENKISNRTTIDNLVLNKWIKNKEILSIGLYDREGYNIYSNLYFDTQQVTSFSKEFFNVMQESSDKLVYIGHTKDFFSMGPVLFFARNTYSITASYGNKMGYFVMSVDAETVLNITNETKLGDSGYFYLADNKGNVINGSRYDSDISAIQNDLKLSAEIKGKEGYRSVWHNNSEYMAFYETLDIGNLKIIGIVPMNEIISKVYPLLSISITILVGCIILILVVSSIIWTNIARPLKKLQGLMGQIENGNLKVRMKYNGKDEIADLAESFNFMIDKLNMLIFENYQTKLRESELVILNKEAQFKALQQQINPHFLYNTLESINWMAYKIGATDIYSMVNALGRFFRGVISRGDDIISFGEEIDYLKNYIYIQKTRYQDKLDIILEIDDEIKEFKTIRLILQPIVENAIVHGVERLKKGGIVRVRGYVSGIFVCFEIQDNGVGMPEKKLKQIMELADVPESEVDKSAGIGVINVYRRLKLYFGEESSFKIESEEGEGTSVKFSIPVKK